MLSVGTVVNQAYQPFLLKELSFHAEINAQNSKTSFKIKYNSLRSQASTNQTYCSVFANPNDIFDLRVSSAGRIWSWKVQGCDSSTTHNQAPSANHKSEIQLIKNHFSTESVVVMPTGLLDAEIEVHLLLNQVTSIEKGAFVYELGRESFFSKQPIPLVSSTVHLQDPRGIKCVILQGDWNKPGRYNVSQTNNKASRIHVDTPARSFQTHQLNRLSCSLSIVYSFYYGKF